MMTPCRVWGRSMLGREDTRRRHISEFMAERGLKIKPWCAEAGIAESGLRNYLEGRTASMTYDGLDKLALAADTTVAEMVGEKLRKVQPGADIIAIKSLDVRSVDNSNGFEIVDDQVGAPFFFRRAWIERKFDQRPENLRVISAMHGDAMMPTIGDGDIGIVALLGEGAKFRSGAIYALWNGQNMIVKRLESLIGERPRLRIISDNREIFEPYEVDADDVMIIGRVVWRSGFV